VEEVGVRELILVLERGRKRHPRMRLVLGAGEFVNGHRLPS
jgi:hypothetical protein